MKVEFEEWYCANINKNEKDEIEKIIKFDLIKDNKKMKHIPAKLTVSLFQVPSSTLLKGVGVGSNGEHLVSFTCSIAKGHDRQYSY